MFTVFSLDGAIGANFRNKKAFNNTLENFKFDFLPNDGGTIDIGPYYLGANEVYASDEALKNDINYLLELRKKNKCQIAVGSCGWSGAKAHVERFVKILSELLIERKEEELKIAVIDATVNPEEALRREIKEELNLQIYDIKYLLSIPNIYEFEGIVYHTLDLVFACKVKDFETIQTDDDVSGFKFIPIDKVSIDDIGLRSAKEIVKILKTTID